MAYTNFYCQYDHASASNNNGGSSVGAPVVTYTNGGWDQGTGVFTPAGGANPQNDGVQVDQWVSIYIDGTAAPTAFIGCVNAVTSTTFTVNVSTIGFVGTSPATLGTGRTAVVGGVWKGPNAASGFPLSFLTNAARDSGLGHPRCNMKNNASYVISTGITRSLAGPIVIEGYTTNPSDGGVAVIDATTSAITPFTVSGAVGRVRNMRFATSATTGSTYGVSVTTGGDYWLFERCIANGARRSGFYLNGYATLCLSCEAYDCAKNNTAGFGGFNVVQYGSAVINCWSHHHAGGTNADGYVMNGKGASAQGCIAENCAGAGFNCILPARLVQCDAYKNGLSGFLLAPAAADGLWLLLNCNSTRNGTGGTGYGIEGSGAYVKAGLIKNCGGYGNTSGWSTGLSALLEEGTLTYGVNTDPWTNPETPDFTIALAAAKGAGHQTLLRTYHSLADQVGYPDVGAMQHLESAAGGSRGVIIGG